MKEAKRQVNNIGKKDVKKDDSPSQFIGARIQELCDWRGETLAKVRQLIKEADPEVVEEWKWVKPTNPGTPVWSHNGGICTGETYKSAVKLTFLCVFSYCLFDHATVGFSDIA